MSKFVIPEGTRIIGADAFRDCNNLKEITIPASVIEIIGRPFDSYNGNIVRLIVPKDLYAEQYCREYGLNYIAA